MNHDAAPLANFSGKARLFPLPNLVVFPNVVQPLHIFEPRYRQMVADALDTDRLIAMALLKPGWEEDYEGRPAVYPVACLGKIIADQQSPDGRYNLLLRGERRIRIDCEVPDSKLYRTARAELVADIMPMPPGDVPLRELLLAAAPNWFPQQDAVVQKIQNFLGSDLPVGVLCDVISFALAIEVESKQELLAEVEVERRIRRLFEIMAPKPALSAKAGTPFPPKFSAN